MHKTMLIYVDTTPDKVLIKALRIAIETWENDPSQRHREAISMLSLFCCIKINLGQTGMAGIIKEFEAWEKFRNLRDYTAKDN